MMLNTGAQLAIWSLCSSPESTDCDVDKDEPPNCQYGRYSNFYRYSQEYIPRTLDFTFSIPIEKSCQRWQTEYLWVRKNPRYKDIPAMTNVIITIMAAFASEFTRPTWNNIQTLLIGAILCRGPRRISSILRVMDLGGERNFSKYHRVLSRAQWNGLALSKILLGLLVQILPTSLPILIAVDETLERRQGKKIKAKGIYRDAVRSSQSHVVTSFGLKWECMALIVPLPWCRRPWALPFLTLLSPSKKSNETAGRKHKTSIDWTQQMVKLVSRWLKRASWILLGDGAYACMALAQTCLTSNVTLISRLRLDAQLFKFPEFAPRQLGRKWGCIRC